MFVSPSHTVVPSVDGRVVIKDLELFVGFDPTIDDNDDTRLKKYDRDTIGKILAGTRARMQRGQRPKLILGHNGDTPSEFPRPVVGDILSVKQTDIGPASGIVGDVEMSVDEFDAYIKSNRYPRRSAEIWPEPEWYLSEVALLGSETPARPLPDTRFSAAEFLAGPDLFARQYQKFAEPTETPHSPGPNNVGRGENTMTDDERIKTLEDELQKLRAKAKKSTKNMSDDDENDDDEKSAKHQADDDDKSDAQKHAKRSSEVDQLRRELLVERYSRKVDKLRAEGYVVGDEKQAAQIIGRIASAGSEEAADAEFQFVKQMLAGNRIPIGLRIDTEGARTGAGDSRRPDGWTRTEIMERVSARCQAEGKPEMYSHYLRDEYEKIAGAKAG